MSAFTAVFGWSDARMFKLDTHNSPAEKAKLISYKWSGFQYHGTLTSTYPLRLCPLCSVPLFVISALLDRQ